MSALQKLHDAADTLLAEVESGGSYKVTREALRKALDDADAVLKAPASSAEPVTDDELAEVEALSRRLQDTTLGAADFARRCGAERRLAVLAPKLGAEVRANRLSLAESNAALKRVTAERDDFETRAALLRTAAKASAAAERDRVRRLFDHHMIGLTLDDDVKRALAAFAADVASGVDRRHA